MPDREKVVALLERYVRIPNLAGAENYGAKIVDMPAPLITDALALLKAQEPVKPIRDINGVYYCGNCDTICVGYEVEFTNSIIKVENYCHKCGRKVKWDG